MAAKKKKYWDFLIVYYYKNKLPHVVGRCIQCSYYKYIPSYSSTIIHMLALFDATRRYSTLLEIRDATRRYSTVLDATPTQRYLTLLLLNAT
jgi:hypothetical protein